ncbi:hypothetical protein JAAARDRAFT_39245 [Jaapia argillacea MUCL 33604]|uniref:Uncharacterized protein n=1 Tax=Jaapia argillacea MUCL 33604 TaxID=933084 RepID=A0A067PF70_9AGAM|nr:hypothetical protein JAAARDRAFT_39245 [Jaapia argillacea MUCL 33604]
MAQYKEYQYRDTSTTNIRPTTSPYYHRPRYDSTTRRDDTVRSKTPLPSTSRLQPSRTHGNQNLNPRTKVTPRDGERTEELYSWMIEQEFLGPKGKYSETERWVHGQKGLSDSKQRDERKKKWDNMFEEYEVQAAAWAAREEEVRRKAIEREMERTRLVREQMERIEERIRQKREAERQKIAEERKATNASERFRRERRVTETMSGDRAVVDTWKRYEARWAVITAPTSSTDLLGFRTIPWPQVQAPNCPSDISPYAITTFILSPLHSGGQSRKDRIRSALLRWHPDRFRRLLGRVAPRDRQAIEEGVGIVTRCLNDMMAREASVSAYHY